MTYTRKQWIAAIIWTVLSALIIPAAIVYGGDTATSFKYGKNIFVKGGAFTGWTRLEKEIQTKHTTIRFSNPSDLIKFNRSIASWGWFTKKTAAENVDAIFERVVEILGMEKKYKKVVIDLSQDRETLKTIWDKPDMPLAFYGNGTIYSHIDDIDRGVLAHEMCHHVINGYLLVRPPNKTAEILAHHIDRTL